MSPQEIREIISELSQLKAEVKSLKEEKRLIVHYLYELAKANGNENITSALKEELPRN